MENDFEPAGKAVALVVGDKVIVSNTETEASLSARLTRFVIVSVVAGLLLAVMLGYESIRTQLAVSDVTKQARTIELLRDDRAQILAAQRVSSCTFTKQFVHVFRTWAQGLVAIDVSELTAHRDVINHKKRIKNYKQMFIDLDSLGSVCLKPPDASGL